MLQKQKATIRYGGQWLVQFHLPESPYPLTQIMTIMLMPTKIFAAAILPPVNVELKLPFV